MLAHVGINRRQDVVKQHDAVLALEARKIDGSCQRDALFLPSAQIHTLLSNFRQVSSCHKHRTLRSYALWHKAQHTHQVGFADPRQVRRRG